MMTAIGSAKYILELGMTVSILSEIFLPAHLPLQASSPDLHCSFLNVLYTIKLT